MHVDTEAGLLSALPNLDPSRLARGNGPGRFASILAGQTAPVDSSQSPLDRQIAALKEKGFTGFFEALEEEKIKELREKILREMGLTEEKLAELQPEQRAAVERMIADEIQRRMAVGSMADKDPEISISGRPDQVSPGGLEGAVMAAGTGAPNAPASSLTAALLTAASDPDSDKGDCPPSKE